MTASASDEAVRTELWASFSSLLRAYMAAASMGSEFPQGVLLAPTSNELHLEGTQRTVKLSVQMENGDGLWTAFEAPAGAGDEETLLDEGRFRLSLDGTFVWSGKPGKLEMDTVAEALATLVVEQV